MKVIALRKSTTQPSRRLYSWELFLVVFVLLVFVLIPCSYAATVKGKVVDVQGKVVELNIGSDRGIKVGDSGRVYFMIEFGPEKKLIPIYVAKFKITHISPKSSVAKIVVKEAEIQVGYLTEVTVKTIKEKPSTKTKEKGGEEIPDFSDDELFKRFFGNRNKEEIKQERLGSGFLGVYIQDINLDLARKFGLQKAQGVLISDVIPNSPAERGKIQKGDVVLEYDGQQVQEKHQLTKMVCNTPVGKDVRIVVWRNKQQKILWVTIGEVPEKQGAAAPPEPERWGFTVQAITPKTVDQLGLPDNTGVVVIRVETNSPAQKEGLQVGDVVIEVEHNQIKNLADFRKYVELYKERKTLLLTVRRKAHDYHALFMVLEKK